MLSGDDRENSLISNHLSIKRLQPTRQAGAEDLSMDRPL